jgi:K+-sensing histidine kinase KdpD
MVDQTTPKPITDQELASLRSNINLLRSQLQTGRVDGAFLSRQVDLLNDFLIRTDAERKQHKKEGRFQALYNVSRLLGASLDLQTVLDQVMDAIIQLTNAERGFLMLRDDDGGLGVQVARNLDQQTLGGDHFKYSRTIANQVLDNGKAILTTNAQEDPRFAGQASIVGQALRSIMATPLRARGSVIGVVYVDNRMMASLFNEDDLAALDAFAAQAAVALDNARLFSQTDQELAQRVEELQRLRRIDRLLSETLDADKAMQITLEWACRLSNATGGYLALLEGDPPTINIAHQFHPNEQAVAPPTLYPEVETAISGARTLILNPEQGNGRAVAIVPIRREARVVGLVIIEREGQMPFTADEQDIIERVIVRAAIAIENARLYAAVRAADNAKSEFVGIVAHDLKVPMTSISGYADLTLIQGSLSERQTEFIGRIKDTVKRMAMLVSDLADISRIESGVFYMNETRVKVTDIVQAVHDGSMTQMQQYQHEYGEEIEPNLPDLRVDYYRLVQVLTNLVSNAYKYTPDGGKIRLRVYRDSDGRVAFAVADTGIGLSKEAIAKLGTKFWRAEDEFTRSRPGTGLGYAITRSLVEQMGSRILIESEVGRGSQFSFSVTAEG